jgi:hypothetical protein
MRFKITLTFFNRLIFEDKFILVALGVNELVLPLSDNQLDIVNKLERFLSVLAKNIIDLQNIALVIINSPLHQSLLKQGMVYVVYQKSQVILKDSHKCEPSLLEYFIIFNPLLLL